MWATLESHKKHIAPFFMFSPFCRFFLLDLIILLCAAPTPKLPPKCLVGYVHASEQLTILQLINTACVFS